jgi:hypothetical protein
MSFEQITEENLVDLNKKLRIPLDMSSEMWSMTKLRPNY